MLNREWMMTWGWPTEDDVRRLEWMMVAVAVSVTVVIAAQRFFITMYESRDNKLYFPKNPF